jgi:hypothetical protein
MFISTEEYLHRITYALEHVVAPLIESDFGRGQLLAAVFLLDQLADRVDYKAEIIQQEIETGCETIRKIVAAVEEREGQVPEGLGAFLDELDRQGPGLDLAFRSRCDEMLCSAIDAFFAHRSGFDPASAHALEGLILGHLTQIASRDLGMFKPSTSQELLDSRGKSA